MRRRIWLDQSHIPVTLSRFGFSLLLMGVAESDRAKISAVSLILRQGPLRVGPRFVSYRLGLLLPTLATRALGRFAANLDKGLAISATFSPYEGLTQGLATLEATVFWADGFQEDLRLATLSLHPVLPHNFATPSGPDRVGIALATYNPDISLFRSQIETIRKQTHKDWVCAISDDCSSPLLLDEMRAIL